MDDNLKSQMPAEDLGGRIRQVTEWLAGRTIERQLQDELMAAFPPNGREFQALASVLRKGLTSGSLGKRVDETTVYAHLSDPSPDTSGFSADVVLLTDVRGEKHRHPQGEIDMVIPLDPTARFDGQGEGWVVYPPNSAHRPTVRDGSAIVLFLLPNGEMTFD